MTKVSGICGYWLGIAETHQDDHQHTHDIQVRDRIKRESPLTFSGGVATPLGHQRVAKFMAA